MLRWAVTGLFCLLALIALSGAVGHPEGWPAAVVLGLIAAACVFERVRYRPIDPDRPDPRWQVTGERFVDPESGRLVEVWQLPATGERRYVDIGAPAAPLA